MRDRKSPPLDQDFRNGDHSRSFWIDRLGGDFSQRRDVRETEQDCLIYINAAWLFIDLGNRHCTPSSRTSRAGCERSLFFGGRGDKWHEWRRYDN